MGVAAAALALLNLIVLWLVAQRLINADRVDAELLCSALGAYLLLGVFWAETYEIISFVARAASFAGPGGAAPTWSALLYFSFTTLTTTGYGDITAINPVVRMWSIFEAIVGTMYNATELFAWFRFTAAVSRGRIGERQFIGRQGRHNCRQANQTARAPLFTYQQSVGFSELRRQ